MPISLRAEESSTRLSASSMLCVDDSCAIICRSGRITSARSAKNASTSVSVTRPRVTTTDCRNR